MTGRLDPRIGSYLMIALLGVTAAGKAVMYDTLDPDCFWHLRVAEQLKRDGIGPLVDQISFASSKEPWTPYSWLAELGMKAIWDAGGYQAAVLTQAMMMGSFVVLIGLSCKERSQTLFGSIISTAFAMYWSLPYLSFRPVTFALMLLALCAWLVNRDRRMLEQSRAIWLIVPVTVLLANVHFFAFLVPCGMAAVCFSAINKRRSMKLLLLSSLAAMCTPMLPGIFKSILRYQFEDPMLSANFIAEVRPFYAAPLGWLSVLLLLGAVACAIANRRRLRASDWILLIGSVLLLLRLGRFSPAYAMVCAPILAATMPRLSDGVLARRPIVAAASILLIAAFVRMISSFPTQDFPIDRWLNRHGPEAPGFPTAAADFVERHVPRGSGRLINEFNWGGYLGWRLGDSFQVLMDGRTQVYPPQFWREAYVEDRADVDRLTGGASTDAAIVPLLRSRLREQLIDRGWQSVYRDDRAEVLVPGAPAGVVRAEE